MAFFKSTCFSLVLLAMVILALATSSRVEGSSFTAYGGPGCSGNSEVLNLCGCSDIGDFTSGYEFSYTGQTAALYNQPGCEGVAQSRFGSSASGCTPFGWQSIFIQC
ncbi:hypothetical protein ACLOJK_020369 [Asimina triloba]